MGGSLGQRDGAGVKRQIKVVNITGFSAAQIETEFNANWGGKGWRIVQVIVIGANTFMIAEREI